MTSSGIGGRGHMSRALRVSGVFAGIGGFERGLEAAGHETVQLCEIDEAARAVLETRFQGVEIVPDVRDLVLPPEVDVVVAGFPCQDLSQAGRTNGIRGDRSGIVESLFEALEDAPTPVPWLLIENVPFMLHLKRGSAMEYLTGRLEELGYSWAYRVIDSRAFGLPQRRRRVYLLASLESDPGPILLASEAAPRLPDSHKDRACGFYWTEGNRGLGWAIDAIPPLKGGSGLGIPSAPAIWMPDGRIGTPTIRDAERLQGFPANWTQPAEDVTARSHRWRLVGNAVTVDVARWLGERLAETPWLDQRIPQVEVQDSWPKAAFSQNGRRVGARVGSWPVQKSAPRLVDFLDDDLNPLSERATTGFKSRLEGSSLRNYPRAEFHSALDVHLRTIRRIAE